MPWFMSQINYTSQQKPHACNSVYTVLINGPINNSKVAKVVITTVRSTSSQNKPPNQTAAVQQTDDNIHRCSTSRRLYTVMLSRSGYGLRRINFVRFSNSLRNTPTSCIRP